MRREEDEIIYDFFAFLSLLYFNYKAELKMNALREREINNNLERRLSEEQKLRGESRCFFSHSNYDCRDSLAAILRLARRGMDRVTVQPLFARTCCRRRAAKKSIETFHQIDFCLHVAAVFFIPLALVPVVSCMRVI